MKEIKDNAPFFELQNNLTPDNSPIGYPNMSGENPSAYAKLEPPKRKYVYYALGMQPNKSINPANRKK